MITIRANLRFHGAQTVNRLALRLVGLPEPLLSGPSYNLLPVPARLELVKHPANETLIEPF
tara:strand:- start:1242 stop:1424 length:183 start_codon:yes stop_codon:yes gene_type:complete